MKRVFVSKPKTVAAVDKCMVAHREAVQEVVRPLVQKQDKRQVVLPRRR